MTGLRLQTAAVASAALIALVGCSNDEPAPSSSGVVASEPAPGASSAKTAPDVAAEDDGPPWPPGKFVASAPSGGDLMLEVPADSAPPDVEEYRKEIDGDPVAYIEVDVDNRDGTEYVNMYEVDIFDPDGTKYEFTNVTDAIDTWTEDLPYDTNEQIDVLNEGTDLTAKYEGGASPSERKTMLLAGEEVPEEIQDIQVYAEGGVGEVAHAWPENSDQERSPQASQGAEPGGETAFDGTPCVYVDGVCFSQSELDEQEAERQGVDAMTLEGYLSLSLDEQAAVNSDLESAGKFAEWEIADPLAPECATLTEQGYAAQDLIEMRIGPDDCPNE
ncbi:MULTISPECIES: hypothetical protein [unclassified Isoptericola]|uniref:hypothetical protein n=1 Tax=unclassified Isoptericola TaxID=2623355 RepID=UPI0036537DEF